MNELPTYYTQHDLAEHYGCSLRTIQREVKSGLLKNSEHLGRKRLFTVEDVRLWHTRRRAHLRGLQVVK